MLFGSLAILHFCYLNIRYSTSRVTNDGVIRIFLSDLVLNLLPFKFHRCTIYYVEESTVERIIPWDYILLFIP